VAASVIGTSLNISTLWQQASSSTPTVVTVTDAKGHRAQTNVTVLGMGQSGSVPAIIPASITVSDCTTNIPFVFFGGTPPFKVYSGDSVHVPVSAPLPFGANSYFTASIRNPTINPFTGLPTATLTVLDSQSKTATTEVRVPSLLTCPNNPVLEVAVSSNVAKETEQISFQVTGSAPPYTVTVNNYRLPNDSNLCPLPTSANPFPIVSASPVVAAGGQFSFSATAAQIAALHDGSALICTAMLTITGSDNQQKNVVLTVYPIVYPQPTP
jgi:hypothetical protein